MLHLSLYLERLLLVIWLNAGSLISELIISMHFRQTALFICGDSNPPGDPNPLRDSNPPRDLDIPGDPNPPSDVDTPGDPNPSGDFDIPGEPMIQSFCNRFF